MINMVDVIIIVFLIAAIYRGRHLGFLPQAMSLAGFFGGLFIGSFVARYAARLLSGQISRGLATILIVLVTADILSTIARNVGYRLQQRVHKTFGTQVESILGVLLSVSSVLVAAWLIGGMLAGFPLVNINRSIDQSTIISSLNRTLPPVPKVISSLSRLVEPNGFPKVFLGSEPQHTPIGDPKSPEVAAAAAKASPSTVKISGFGCGGVVFGSGFVVADNYIATNAHVVAGLTSPVVEDKSGQHRATTVYFDPNMDFAVLKTHGLSGPPLTLDNQEIKSGTSGAILGYPGGGGLTVSPTVVVDERLAIGRNIYDEGLSRRHIYEVQATVEPGNSGGPLVLADGRVAGVVFAKAVSADDFGYTLTSTEILNAVQQATGRSEAVDTGACISG
jgi:S1-C subfamily serine protease